MKNEKKKWKESDEVWLRKALLGIAKALTGGLEMVITATPSFPTSIVTRICDIALLALFCFSFLNYGCFEKKGDIELSRTSIFWELYWCNLFYVKLIILVCNNLSCFSLFGDMIVRGVTLLTQLILLIFFNSPHFFFFFYEFW